MLAGSAPLLLLASVRSAAPPTINWMSSPVGDGETVLLSGGGFTNSSVVTLVDSAGTKVQAQAENVHQHGLAFKMPGGKVGSLSLYDVSVDGSEPSLINFPEAWWWQGDAGNSSTPGGWLRVFGRSIAVHSAERSTAAAADRAALDAAVSRGNFAQAHQLIDRLELLEPTRAPSATTQLRLTPKSSSPTAASAAPTVISAVAANSSVFEARFELPSTLAPGEYTAELSNGLSSHSKGQWFPMEMFIGSDSSYPVGDGSNGRLSTVTISKARVWPSTVFKVDCEWDKPIFERPCGWVGARDTGQIDAALAKARAAGGGVVYLPRGQYYIDGPIIVPPNTRLRGEGEDLVAIYFREQQPWEAPMPGYIHANNSAAAWALEDLAVYVSSFYHSVVHVGPSTVDFTMQRVRVRAAAYAMLDDRTCGTTCGANSRGNNISCLNDSCPDNKHRFANFTHMSSGEVVMLAGNSGYQITDCDLLGTAIIIHTGTHGASSGAPARYGYIARNVLWNANAAHWFDGIKEVIFEYNEIKPGGASASWGDNIDTYAGGWAGHVWHAHNTFASVWMNDREYMTFDGSQAVYFGPASQEAGSATITLSEASGSAEHAACATVLDGTGAGQYGRIVGWTKGGNLTNQTITLDQPFVTPVDETSTIQLGTCHMMILFHDNYYADGGAVQMIGDGQDIIVSETRFERTEGLYMWGRSAGHGGYSPNCRVQFLGNTVLEGNHLWNYNGSYPYGYEPLGPASKTAEPFWMGVPGGGQGPGCPFQGAINHNLVFRANKFLSNSGLIIAGNTLNGLVEDNTIVNSSVGINVTATLHDPTSPFNGQNVVKHVLVTNNDVTID